MVLKELTSFIVRPRSARTPVPLYTSRGIVPLINEGNAVPFSSRICGGGGR